MRTDINYNYSSSLDYTKVENNRRGDDQFSVSLLKNSQKIAQATVQKNLVPALQSSMAPADIQKIISQTLKLSPSPSQASFSLDLVPGRLPSGTLGAAFDDQGKGFAVVDTNNVVFESKTLGVDVKNLFRAIVAQEVGSKVALVDKRLSFLSSTQVEVATETMSLKYPEYLGSHLAIVSANGMPGSSIPQYKQLGGISISAIGSWMQRNKLLKSGETPAQGATRFLKGYNEVFQARYADVTAGGQPSQTDLVAQSIGRLTGAKNLAALRKDLQQTLLRAYTVQTDIIFQRK